MNILAIGAHPDDVEFGCFGTLKKHINDGDKVYILVMSLSDVSDYDGNKIRIREESKLESDNAANMIGASIDYLNYEDTKIPFDSVIVGKIEKYIKEKNIDMIYTHWTGDTHQDHINTIKSTLAASRYVNNVLCYEQVPLPRVGIHKPEINYYVDISDVIDIKIKSCECHKKQIDKFNNQGFDIIDAIENLSKYRGDQIGVKYAESFHILKMVKK